MFRAIIFAPWQTIPKRSTCFSFSSATVPAPPAPIFLSTGGGHLLLSGSIRRAFLLVGTFLSLALIFSASVNAQGIPRPLAESNVPVEKLFRSVMGSGGQQMTTGPKVLRGTISQTTIGMTSRGSGNGMVRNQVGFWYFPIASRGCAEITVRIPCSSAEPGTELTIPLEIAGVSNWRFGNVEWKARIRFNGTLLEPVAPTPDCITWEGDQCVIEIGGVTNGEEGAELYAMRFLAKMGNDTATAMVIEDFHFVGGLGIGENCVNIYKEWCDFGLLGVCRDGNGGVRLIRVTGPASRVRATPNPASERTVVEYVSAQEGHIRLSLTDALGREVALLLEEEVESATAYRAELDLSQISSGSYFLVLTTPTDIKTTRLMVEQ